MWFYLLSLLYPWKNCKYPMDFFLCFTGTQGVFQFSSLRDRITTLHLNIESINRLHLKATQKTLFKNIFFKWNSILYGTHATVGIVGFTQPSIMKTQTELNFFWKASSTRRIFIHFSLSRKAFGLMVDLSTTFLLPTHT